MVKRNLINPFELGARGFVDHIETCIGASLDRNNLHLIPPDEREHLEYSQERLRTAFDEVAKHFVDPTRDEDPSLCEYGYEKLWELTAAAFLAGSYGIQSTGIKNALKPEIMEEGETIGRKAAAKSGGKGSGKTRRANAIKWRRDLWIFCKTKVTSNPRLDSAGLFNAIERARGSTLKLTVGQLTYGRHVRKWMKTGWDNEPDDI